MPSIAPQPAQAPISLQEHESVEVVLSGEAYAALRERYSRQVEVTHTARAQVYRLAARDYVGRVSLPGGRLLVIRPKVGVANLFYMLCADAGLAGFHPPPTGLHEEADIFPFVLAALLASIDRLLASGLYQDYALREERLPYVRGRILLARQARHGWLQHLQSCLYAERSLDTTENRVVAAALRLVPRLLDREEQAPLAARARSLLRHFAGVQPLGKSQALAALPRIDIHRLNAPYGPALALCGLALRGLTLNEQAGGYPYASFLVDMPALFESFLTKKLAAALPAHGLRVVPQRYDYLDDARTIGIRPDVLVFRAAGGHRGEPLLVLDAKYRRPDGPQGDANRDLYQVSAYLDRYGLRRGVLVYPRFEQSESVRLNLKGTPKSIQIAWLDLGTPGAASLDAECDNLALAVARLARGE